MAEPQAHTADARIQWKLQKRPANNNIWAAIKVGGFQRTIGVSLYLGFSRGSGSSSSAGQGTAVGADTAGSGRSSETRTDYTVKIDNIEYDPSHWWALIRYDLSRERVGRNVHPLPCGSDGGGSGKGGDRQARRELVPLGLRPLLPSSWGKGDKKTKGATTPGGKGQNTGLPLRTSSASGAKDRQGSRGDRDEAIAVKRPGLEAHACQ